MSKYDVYGIGNPIVDILAKVEDEHLEKLNLPKGIMSLVDQNRSKQLLNSVRLMEKTIMPGGSCCNTMIGVANLGGKAVFAGAIGDDDHGRVFATKLHEFGVVSNLIKTNAMTGSSVILVTPDSERTMNTHLGACGLLDKNHVSQEHLLNSKIFYTTGYALDTFPETTMYALEIARQNKIKISFDLSDSFLIRDKKEEIKYVVKNYADIVFLNEEEARLFTGKKPINALNDITKLCDIVALKIGAKGSIISQRGTIVRAPGFKINALDTTGAGDMYAAGFLFGITNGYSLKDAAMIGNYGASKIVEVMGARIEYSLKEKVRQRFNDLQL